MFVSMCLPVFVVYAGTIRQYVEACFFMELSDAELHQLKRRSFPVVQESTKRPRPVEILDDSQVDWGRREPAELIR